jgi:hypothetical protein
MLAKSRVVEVTTSHLPPGFFRQNRPTTRFFRRGAACIRGALIAQGWRQSVKKRPITREFRHCQTRRSAHGRSYGRSNSKYEIWKNGPAILNCSKRPASPISPTSLPRIYHPQLDGLIRTPVCLRLAGAFAKCQTAPLHQRHTFVGAKPPSQATRQDVQGYRGAFTRTGSAMRHSTFHHWSGCRHREKDRPTPKAPPVPGVAQSGEFDRPGAGRSGEKSAPGRPGDDERRVRAFPRIGSPQMVASGVPELLRAGDVDL